MKNLKRIIDLNPGVDFVVMTHNKEEYVVFADTVLGMGFDFVIIPEDCDGNRDAMDRAAESCDYKCGWRVSRTRGIAFNESQEHWEKWYKDVMEVREDGNLHFTDEK